MGTTRGVAAFVLALASCARDTRDLHSARIELGRDPTRLAKRTRSLCPLVGPKVNGTGVYGTDLGYTAKDPANPGRLAIFFGDTWATRGEDCHYPVFPNDDLIASLPEQRPSELDKGTRVSASACASLTIARNDAKDATSWQRVRLFSSLDAKQTDTPLDTGGLRTPVSSFSTGENLFLLYYRGGAVTCKDSTACSNGMVCSSDAPGLGRRLGVCAHPRAAGDSGAPAYCRNVGDCGQGLECRQAERGVCLAPSDAGSSGFSPSWERDDPRALVARTIDIAVRAWPNRPEDYAVVHAFETNRFTNVAARTVAYFDPTHPERNDYRPGTHTLLLFGRAAFFTTGGVQALPFLLYQPLEGLRGDPHAIRWDPRFFAGYDSSGKPRWSSREIDAVPVYGTEVRVRNGRIEWAEPEFDYVTQMTVSYVAPLRRWIMLYGGDVPAFMIRDPRSGVTPNPVYPQPSPGAIHLRAASHPWGRFMNDRVRYSGWSSPEPLLTRRQAAPYLACPDEGRDALPGCVPGSEAASKSPQLSPSCVGGAVVMRAQVDLSGNKIGRLYGANVIDEWTRDRTTDTPGLGGDERIVDVYWNASTWSPYQVVLFETELRGRVAPE
jgi:hypothetical protein